MQLKFKKTYAFVVWHKAAFECIVTVTVAGIIAKKHFANVHEPLVSFIPCLYLFYLGQYNSIHDQFLWVILHKVAKACKCHFYCCGLFCD
jgi:hypothetical protein